MTHQVALLGMLTLHNQSTVLHPRITGLKLPPEPTSCIFKLVSPLFQECFLPPGENPCKHLSWNGNLLKADWVEVGHERRLCQVGQGQGLHSTDGIPENSSRILESDLRSLNLLCHSVSELAKLIRLPKGVNNCVRVTAKVRQLRRNHGIRVQTIPPCTTRRTAVYLKYNNMRMLIVDCQGLAETIVLIEKWSEKNEASSLRQNVKTCMASICLGETSSGCFSLQPVFSWKRVPLMEL